MWRFRFVRFMIIIAFLVQASALYFEPNRGQTAAQVKFLSPGTGTALLLTAQEVILTRYQSICPTTLATSFIGANPDPKVMGEAPLSEVSHYVATNDPHLLRTCLRS